jgi:hypothetical protein
MLTIMLFTSRQAITQSYVTTATRKPFQVQLSTGQNFVVPAGRIFVIESVDASLQDNIAGVFGVAITTTTGGNMGIHRIDASRRFNSDGITQSFYSPSKQVTFYADPGSTIYLGATSPGVNCTATLTGYLVKSL